MGSPRGIQPLPLLNNQPASNRAPETVSSLKATNKWQVDGLDLFHLGQASNSCLLGLTCNLVMGIAFASLHCLRQYDQPRPHKVSDLPTEIPYNIAWIHFTAKKMGLGAHGYGIHWSYPISSHPEAYGLTEQGKQTLVATAEALV